MFPALKILAVYWKLLILILAPFVLLPVYFAPTGNADPDPLKFRCAYVILLMGTYWMSEAMPLAVTAFIPVVLFPIFNIQSTGDVCQNYMRESVMMFMAGICLALAIEYSGLHRRIALKTLTIIGTSPWRLLLGIMMTTMFLTMWIVINTAVAAMMIPIAEKLSALVENYGDGGDIDKVDDKSESIDIAEDGPRRNSARKDNNNLKKLFMLAVGFAANIGGTSTIIGSNPNLVAKELLAAENIGQDGKYTDVNFSTWIAFNFPIAAINLTISWIYLGLLYIGPPKWLLRRKSNSRRNTVNGTDLNVKKMLEMKLSELGPISFHEFGVTVLFAVVILLWFTRDPQMFAGWVSLFDKAHVNVGDSTVALAIVVLMFIIPNNPRLRSVKTGNVKDSSEGNKGEHDIGTTGTLLSWDVIQKRCPWSVIILVGGGFAISDAANKSGLSKWVGEQLSGLDSLPNPVILLIFLLVISILTEIISNAACVNLILPILIALSKKLNLHPLYLSLPGAIACQYAFCLPVSNPPNAIVFTAGEMKIMDMVKAGAFLNFACLTVLYLMNLSWGQVIFNYSSYQYPE